MDSPFILGEDKKVKLKIINTSDEIFRVREATFDLLKDGIITQSGNCTIENDVVLSVQLKPTETGTYTLIYTFGIADETFKKKVTVCVYD